MKQGRRPESEESRCTLSVNRRAPSSSVWVKIEYSQLSGRFCSLVLSLALDAQPETLG
jgi:hypothetical protein